MDRHRDGPARAGPRSGSVACQCGTVSRSFSAIIAGTKGARRHGQAPHVPQPGTELEEFFDLTIDPLSIVGFDGEFRRVNPSFLCPRGIRSRSSSRGPRSRSPIRMT